MNAKMIPSNTYLVFIILITWARNISANISFLNFEKNGIPDGVCSIDGQMCEIHDNIVVLMHGVATRDECRLLCQDEPACNFITFFGKDSFPFKQTCIIFSSCDQLNGCQDCSTEDHACSPCSSPLETTVDQNLIQILPDVKDEITCKEACTNDTSCTYYTHHSLTHPSLPGTCFLLSSLQGPIEPCQHCRTGSGDCAQSAGCFFVTEDGNISASGQIITEPSFSTTVRPLALGTTCTLTLVAVGGGGDGEYWNSGGGGGGSGYIAWEEVSMTGIQELEVNIGEGGRETEVRGEGRKVLVEAQPGGDGDSDGGGDGYSGGGGNGSYKSGAGGTNGGNGHSGSGNDHYGRRGEGNGLDVSSVPVREFILSAGKGGKGEGVDNGGGAGGLLVNEQGNYGRGYGAGGDSSEDGYPGVVILTFK